MKKLFVTALIASFVLAMAAGTALASRGTPAADPKLDCKKTATPTPTAPMTLMTVTPLPTATKVPPPPPTASPTVPMTLMTVTPSPTPKATGRAICVPDTDSVCEMFTEEDWVRYGANLEELEKHRLIEDNKSFFKDVPSGGYVFAFWHESGYMPAVHFTVRAGNHVTIAEPAHKNARTRAGH